MAIASYMENYCMKILLERKIIQTFFPSSRVRMHRHNEIITLLVSG